ncbi:MAG TPA: SRPBCC family protein [Terriglobales bacterium]|nr:SRPBCC family protein [Terriglobales bacterium]
MAPLFARSVSSATGDIQSLDVIVDAQLVAHVHATLELPASPETVFVVLTDYAQWPALFAKGMTIAAIRDEPEGVVTEMYVPRVMLPGTLHVIIRTRVSAPQQIEAELISGDLNLFRRLWRLMPLAKGRETIAELQMTVQPKGWAPRWLIRYAIERELTDHFDRLRAAIQRRSVQEP